MKTFAFILLTLCSVSIFGQVKPEFDGHTWEAPYSLSIPKDWTVERFLIPISFAPQIPYKGVEDIRFSPGWGNAKKEDYWSYAFLWYLEGDVKMESKTLDSNMNAYYTGLIEGNGQNIPATKRIPVIATFSETHKDIGDLKTFIGTIEMLDYMQQKPMTLYCKAHLKSCAGATYTILFLELSPQPLSHAVWLSLDKLWLDFECKKN